MPASYTHTTRANGTVLTAAIYNADHQNHIDNGIPTALDDYSISVLQMQTTIDPGESGSESLATSLAGEIERIRFAIKELKNKLTSTGAAAQWYSSPDVGMSGVTFTIPALSVTNDATFNGNVTSTLSGAERVNINGTSTAVHLLFSGSADNANGFIAMTGTIAYTGTVQTASLSLINNVVPTEISVTTYLGLNNHPLFNSATNWTNVHGTFSRLDLGASSAGSITTYNAFLVANPSKDAASTTAITNYHGINVADPSTITATLIAAFRGQVASGTGKWNSYMSGSADNAFLGNVRIGSIVAPTTALDVTGEIKASGGITQSSSTASSILNIISVTGSADINRWQIKMTDATGALSIQALNDAGSGGGQRIIVTRTANNIQDILLNIIGGVLITEGGSEIATPSRRFHIEERDAGTTNVAYASRITHTTSGTPAAGIGVGMEWEVETSAGNFEVGLQIDAVSTDVTALSEDFDMVIRVMAAGAVPSEQFRVTSTGNIYGKNLHNNSVSPIGTVNQFVASGTYTPTLTNVANLDASTAYQCQWIRVGNVVTVTGKVDVDPTTTATVTRLGISLPLASNLVNAEDCAGSASASGIASQCAAILADGVNDRAQMEWIATDVTNQAMYFTFSYEIL